MVSKTLHATSNILKKFWRQSYSITSRAMSTESNDVVFETVNNAGVMTLNRPKVLNTFTMSMMNTISLKLQEWEHQKSLVLIKGSGEKAFCAGGDVKSIVEALRKGDRSISNIFKIEYMTNGMIGNFCIPYVALIDGITMGGGIGLSVHGHYRICTERSMCAMPETAIGLFPDVGSSYVLPRMQGKLGFYLALSGARLTGSDVLRAGIATHYIESKDLPNLEKEILKCDNHESIKDVLSKLCKREVKEFSLNPHLDVINKCFSGKTMEEIMELLEKDGSEFAKNTIATLNKMSPTSMKITLKLLQLGSNMNLLDCLRHEYRVVIACLANHDFVEGVRSLLIDKDRNPKWKPATLKEVPDSLVESHFTKLPENEELHHISR